MPRSSNYARIKAQVLDICARIPEGRLTTYAAIGDELDVPARHVAYILASLGEAERATVPWHRVLAEDGSLVRRRHDEHAARLADEGVDPGELDERFVRVLLDAEHRSDPATPLERTPEPRPG